MTRLNVKFTHGTMVTVDDAGTIKLDTHNQPILVDFPTMIVNEMNPDPETVYTISMKRVGSTLDIHIDDDLPISYRQLELYVKRLYRKSKISHLKETFDELLASPDISSFERRLRETTVDDPTFTIIKIYLLIIVTYYRSGGSDVRYLNVKNLGEMVDITPTLNELIFIESFLGATSMRDKRTPMMISIISNTYKEIIVMDDEKIREYITSHRNDIRSRVATFLRDGRLKDSCDKTP